MIYKFHKRDIRTLKETLSHVESLENLREADDYALSEEQKQFEQHFQGVNNAYDYIRQYATEYGGNHITIGAGLLELTLLEKHYKKYMDLGTDAGIIPILMGHNKNIQIHAVDYNYRKMEFIKARIQIDNLSFSTLNLFNDDLDVLKNTDVVLLNGTEFALDDDTLIALNKKIEIYDIKEIWLTTNHVFEWNFKPDRSYFINLLYLTLKPKVFKQGRLIGFYRSLSLLLKLFPNFKLIDYRPDFCGTERLFLRLKNKNLL